MQQLLASRGSIKALKRVKVLMSDFHVLLSSMYLVDYRASHQVFTATGRSSFRQATKVRDARIACTLDEPWYMRYARDCRSEKYLPSFRCCNISYVRTSYTVVVQGTAVSVVTARATSSRRSAFPPTTVFFAEVLSSFIPVVYQPRAEVCTCNVFPVSYPPGSNYGAAPLW